MRVEPAREQIRLGDMQPMRPKGATQRAAKDSLAGALSARERKAYTLLPYAPRGRLAERTRGLVLAKRTREA